MNYDYRAEVLTESGLWRPAQRPDENVSAQRKYCWDHGVPMFMPPDGHCFSCGRYIFGERGLTLKDAESRLITGCPYCQRTYVD